MKNLKIFCDELLYDETLIGQLRGSQKMCIDAHDELLYVALGDGHIVIIDKHMKKINDVFIPLEEFGKNDFNSNSLLGMEFLYDDQLVCLVYEQGQIFTANVKMNEVRKVSELIGPVCGCAWSPDIQLLVVATDENLFALSRDFDIISEAPIRPTQTGKDQLLTVGWGSVETQFQGAAGKQNRERLEQERLPVPIREKFDDRRVIISWRADAQFFTVSSVDTIPVLSASMLCRQLRVWNRELELMSRCEFSPGIEAALSMRPSGNLIAVPKISSKEHFIWFYERNGQYRNKFKMCHANDETDSLFSTSVVRWLSWNLDGSILALDYQQVEKHFLQFWTVSNYSWTEKLRLEVEKPLDAFWDTESAHKFHLLDACGRYRRLWILSQYNCEDMIALSINGDRVRITDFHFATIPPPMCHSELDISFGGPPSAFAQSNSFGLALIGADCSKISIFSLSARKFVHRKNLTLPSGNGKMLYNLAWKNENCLAAIRSGERSSELVELHIDTEQFSTVRTLNYNTIGHLVVNNPIKGFAQDQLQIDQTKLSDEGQHSLTFGKLIVKELYQFASVELANETLVLALNEKRQFFANGKMLSSNIGSFCCTSDHLVVSTLDNNLYCLSNSHLSTLLRGETTIIEKSLFRNGCGIQRGTQLVANEPNGTRVWQQMPTGNLELIHPRELLIGKLKLELDSRDWRKAFAEMRRHRIDMNLIYDHNPGAFNGDVAQFVDQLDDVERLNMFLTSLRPENTTRGNGMFAKNYSVRNDVSALAVEEEEDKTRNGKVNSICKRIRDYLLSLPNDKRLLRLYPAVITSFVVQKPMRVSEALIDMQEHLSKMNGNSSPVVHQWLKHMGYLVKENELFKQSLKTYDMHIALLVAESTNLDPKVYLPILNNFKDLSPPLYQRFQIDVYLEDYASALQNIALLLMQQGESPDSTKYLEECTNHIEQHNLHSLALKLFCSKPRYKKICATVAKHEEKKRHFQEAAILYQKANDIASAMNCHFSMQDFRGYLRLAKQNGVEKEIVDNKIRAMAIQLLSKGNPLAAAELYTHLGKEENAAKIIECYAKANAWKCLAELVGEVASDVTREACELLSARCDQIQDQFSSWRSNLKEHANRLLLLRKEKQTKIEEFLSEEARTSEFGDDAFSESSLSSSTLSAASTSSRSSRFSMSRKKQTERKKQQIKKGSQWEDAALLVELKKIYGCINAQKGELVELMPALLSMDLIEQGYQLQASMTDILSYAASLKTSIWPKHIEPMHLPGPIAELYRCENDTIRLPVGGETMPYRIKVEDELLPPEERNDVDWKLNIFKGGIEENSIGEWRL